MIAAFGTLYSRKPNDLFFGKCSGNWTSGPLVITTCSEAFPDPATRPRQREVLIEFLREGEVDEAVRALKKLYLEVVHRIIDHLEAEEPANSSR